MRLLSVSAGKVQIVRIGGEAVRTAHVKEVLPQPWRIDADGVQGDERAVHPDKLYAFARDAYDYWGERLGVEPGSWPDGFFGENLTLDTLDEEDLRVGDVLSLGDEVRLFVAGARNPCNKLCWRLAQPPTFQGIFARSGRAGVYLGVERGGRVRPGDELRRLHHDAAMPSVRTVSGYMIDAQPPPIADLSRLLSSDRLSPTNRLLLGAKVDAARRAADATADRWAGWRSFVVESTTQETPEIRSATLIPADGGPLPRPRPGQSVAVRLADGEGGSLTRSWSLSSFQYDPVHYRLTVRRQAGRGSRRFHELVAGDVVDLRAPAGDFCLDTGSFRPVVLIAAGIGITPLKAMLDAQLTRRDAPPIHLIYGGRDAASLAFLDELKNLASARADVDLTLVYSRDEAAAKRGRLTADLVIAELARLGIVVAGHRHKLPWFEAAIYICGPAELCTSLRSELIERGANPDRVMIELFAPAAVESGGIDEAAVSFARSGTVATWRLEDDLTLLELAEREGVPMASSCRAGTCLTCRSRLVMGDATGALGDGTILPCVARPKTAELVLDI